MSCKLHLDNHGSMLSMRMLLTINYSAWIGFSSSVILFNKWLLDTLNFRTCHDSLNPLPFADICAIQATPSSSPHTT